MAKEDFLPPPVEVVAEAFDRFTIREEHGGFACPHKKTYIGVPGIDHPNVPVESSFDNEQNDYLKDANALLYLLGRGEIRGTRQPEEIPTFTQDIVDAYVGSPNPSFVNAVTSAYFDLLTRFSKYYPSLMPALQAEVEFGGAEGSTASIGRTFYYLDAVIKGKDVDPLVRKHELIGRHYDSHGKPRIQVHCDGPAVANMITHGALAAAKILAVNPEIRENYDVSKGYPMDPYLEYSLKAHIVKLMEDPVTA